MQWVLIDMSHRYHWKATEHKSLVGVIPKEGLAGLVPSFGIMTANILGPVFCVVGLHMSLAVMRSAGK